MENHFFSIYKRSVILGDGRYVEHYVCCYGNYCICEHPDKDRVKKELHRFIDKNLVL